MSNVTRLDRFKDIRDTMNWRDAAITQIDRFRQFAEGLGMPWDAVGRHTSKSIALPVIRITCGDKDIYIRDNFHDLNVCVVSPNPITTPLNAMFAGVLEPRNWDWYLGEIAKCRGYSWREWSDDQMETPGLLALSDDAPDYMVKKPETKRRWRARMTDPAWWGHDWSSGSKITWEGAFGPDATLWVQYHPFMQGIEPLVPSGANEPYKPGCRNFALALGDLEQVKALITRLAP